MQVQSAAGVVPTTLASAASASSSNSISSATSTSASGATIPTPDGVLSQISQYATILNDTSGKYSQAQQMQTYNALVAVAAPGNVIGTDGEDAYVDATQNTAFGSHYQELATNLNNYLESRQTTTADDSQIRLNFFNSLSNSDQQLYVSGNLQGSAKYGSPSAYAAHLQATTNNASASSSSSSKDTVTLSSGAQAALSSGAVPISTGADAAKQALKSLTSPSPSTSGSDVALSILRNATKTSATSKTGATVKPDEKSDDQDSINVPANNKNESLQVKYTEGSIVDASA